MERTRREAGTFECIWIALAALLSASTQLRLKHPIGPGEIMLICWMVKEWYDNRSTSIRKYIFANPLGPFWIYSLIAMLFGWALAVRVGHDSAIAGRDLLSYIFAAIFSITLCSSKALFSYKKLMYWALACTSLLYGFLLVLVLVKPVVGPFHLLYQDFRFEGLTDNPNQVALICSVLPIFLIVNWNTLKLSSKICGSIYFALGIVVGYACSSDAWKLATIFMAAVALLVPFIPIARLWIGEKIPEKSAFRSLGIAATLLVIVGLSFSHAPQLINKVGDTLFHHGYDASDRLNLWQNGLFALRDDPVFGMGPGPHSGFSGPYQEEESHSSFVEWATISGLFACLYLAVLFVVPVGTALKKGNYAVAVGLLAFMIILVFHFLLRHPVLWFYLILLTKASGELHPRTSLQTSGPKKLILVPTSP